MDIRITLLYNCSVSPKRLAAFRIDGELLDGLQILWQRDGVQPAEQVRRAIRMWLESKDIMKTERKRAVTRKRP